MVNWFSAILLTLCMLSGVLLRYVPFAPIVEKKQKNLWITFHCLMCALNVLLIAVAMHFRGLGFATDYLRFGGIIFAGVSVLINILTIPGRLREHLFVFGIVLNCNYLLMTVPNFLFTMIPRLTVTGYLFFLLLSFLGLLVATYWPLRKLLRNTVTPYLHLNIGKSWNAIWAVPIIYFGAKYVSLGGEHNTGSLFQLVGSVLSGVTMILVCLSSAANHGHMQEKQSMEKQLSSQKVYFTELQMRVEEARKTNHDFKHHISAIRHYMNTDDKEGLRRYCDDWMIRQEERGSIPYTGNSAADGILYQYVQQAKEQKVQFQYSGTIRNPGIAEIDLCVLLGNALDNAFTATLNIPEEQRNVTVICQSEETLLSIIVRNSYDGKVQQDGHGLLSRKRNHAPGIGIRSMNSVCDRYGGSLDVYWDETTFTVMIMLPVQKNP